MDEQERARLQAELDAAVGKAFDRYGVSSLWSKQRLPTYSAGAARAISNSLRREAPAAARRLVERIEDLSDAIDTASERHLEGDRIAS